MIHFSLFSGIGGFELAAEWMGWRNLLSCDINEFGNKVRKYYWPDGYCHTDIKTLNYETINKELSDRFGLGWRDDDIIITGGFPCQPYSMAGKRLGKDDERHLWPEMLRVIREVKPTWIVGENVHGLVNWNGGVVFNEVQTDLENEGYEVQAFVLPAASVNAPHRRDRVWVVAHSTYTNIGSTGASRKNRETQGNGRKNDDESKGRGTSGEQYFGCGELLQATSNPNGNGQHWRNGEHEIEPSQRGFDAQRDVEPIRWDDTNGKGKGWGKGIGQKADIKRRQVAESGQERYGLRDDFGTGDTNHATRGTDYGAGFHYFPTQSPICGGDDGLPTELDGITFPKWRNESIKAYGNAVVPQVVYQIFKTIQQYEHTPIK